MLTAVEVQDRPLWYSDALCSEYPELSWFDEHPARSEAVKAVCDRCLVRAECAAFAAEQRDLVGIWGGLTTRERRLQGQVTPAA
jgi:WhiB family redox-sensing transcriptional regulator